MSRWPRFWLVTAAGREMHDELTLRLRELTPQRRQLLEQWLGTSAQDTQTSTELTGLSREKLDVITFYEAIHNWLDASPFGPHAQFLNYGYADDGGPREAAVSVEGPIVNANCVHLVLELIGSCDLRQKRVLDVGCGRGGTLLTLDGYFEPAELVGIDLSSRAIQSSRRWVRSSRIHFERADAEELPFGNRTFDVVTNIESSHSYPTPAQFFREVWRVLRPGGVFLYTDLLPKQVVWRNVELLTGLGFETLTHRDITANVLLACDDGAKRNLAALTGAADETTLREFLAAPGSAVYMDMQTGRAVYTLLRLQKPADSS